MPPWESPAAVSIKGLGKEKAAGLFRLPVSLFCHKSEKVIIFNVFHYILNIAMQNVT